VDAIQIQQVFANLIQNAFAALENTEAYRRRLTIRTSRTHEDGVEVMISDSGCGFPADAIEKLFEPFYSTRQEGTGLGLAIARSIVEAHGGVITAETNSDGGATFRCRLSADGPPDYDGNLPAESMWNPSTPVNTAAADRDAPISVNS
jgi:two-component system sensor kinase FixL